jgi:LysR family transcriptional regulator, hypochlorite-specific transcription factor HypT
MIRFAATQALAITFFPAWLRSFEEQGGPSTITLIADTMLAWERLMLEGRVDFLLCHEHPAAAARLDDGLFRSLLLGEGHLVPVCVADNRQARFALPGDSAAPLSYLAFDERSGMGRILDASGVVTGGHAALRTVFRSHLAGGLLHMARNGMGIAWAPLSLCRDDLEAGSLVRAGNSCWEVPIEIRLFRPKARRNATVEGF